MVRSRSRSPGGAPAVTRAALVAVACASACAHAALSPAALRARLALPLPPRARAGERDVYAVGDVHGDLHALRSGLVAAGVLDERGECWAAGDAVLVQTGDLLDRGPDDYEILRFMRALRRQARACGGEVASVLGNHEVMNVLGDFSCVLDASANEPFDRLMARSAGRAWAADVSDAEQRQERSRAAALAPGGLVARTTLAAPIALTVGRTLFVHGGLLSKHVPHLLEWNAAAHAFVRGNAPLPVEALMRADAPLWTRRYSREPRPDGEACTELHAVLAATGCERMVVGHTPQPCGANCACDGAVWRIDTGMSDFYGGRAEVLRIGSDGGVAVASVHPRAGDAAGQPGAAMWVPASARSVDAAATDRSPRSGAELAAAAPQSNSPGIGRTAGSVRSSSASAAVSSRDPLDC